jgi:2-polyprenyl-3-methyl-5-hydroxy-6-metoxy-1,4-benzoquinol methylase/glycosyltransferase involved in cell wall biosynthesis
VRIAYFSPLGPQRSGIADYSEALLPHLAENADVDLFVDGFVPTNKEITSRFQVRDYKASPAVLENLSMYDATIYHIGNDHRYHSGIYKVSREHPGIVVLHDFALQHFFWGLGQSEGDFASYLDEMEAEAGPGERRLAAESLACGGAPPQLNSPLEFPLNYGLSSRAQAVIVHSEWSRKRLQTGRWTTPVYVIPHLVFDPAHDVPLQKERKVGPVRIASFGRVTADKGIERALRALAKLRDRVEFEYTIVGEVCDYFALDNILRDLGMHDRVTLLGHADIDEFVQHISSTDIAINLREQTVGETSGSLCRIMAAGVAPVVSDVGWFSELPNDCAVKIDMSTCTDELLEAYLIRLIDDSALREQIGRNAQKYVLENYRVEVCAAKYLHAIEETLRTRARRGFLSHVAEQVTGLNINDCVSEDFLSSLQHEIATLAPLPSTFESQFAVSRNGHSSNGKTSMPLAPAVPERVQTTEYPSFVPDDDHQHGRTPIVEGIDYERGALEYLETLDKEHLYYLRTKPFFNIAGRPQEAPLDLDDRPTVETHRQICDFANIVATLALQRGSRILDVGCGSGWLSEWFARLGYDVTGVDISPRLIEISRERFNSVLYDADHETRLRCRFETLNVEREALDERFDAVICYDSLHHFVDEHATIKNLAQMTKLGGTLFILEGNKPPDNSVGASELREVMEKYATLESPFHPAYLRELLIENGFMIVGDYVSVNGLYPRQLLEDDDRLPIRVEPINYILCKKVADGWTARDFPDSRTASRLSARLTALETPIRTPAWDLVRWTGEVEAGSELFVPLKIENTGDSVWLTGRSAQNGVVQVAVKVLDASGNVVSEEHGSPPLPQAMAPGETRTLVIRHPAPANAGSYTLKIDLVSQQVAWFEEHGSTPLVLDLKVI